MQAINRIQNATINANAAGIRGAMVVDGANAHRDYPSSLPCESYPVTKCPSKSSSRATLPMQVPPQVPVGTGVTEHGQFAGGQAGKMWRLQSQHRLMPPTLWATFVLNRQLCS